MRILRSGILPGEEKERAISAKSVIGTNITSSGNTPRQRLRRGAVVRILYSTANEQKKPPFWVARSLYKSYEKDIFWGLQ